MGSKEYYMVPVYVMLAEDFGCGEVDFKFLDNILVSETKNGNKSLMAHIKEINTRES